MKTLPSLSKWVTDPNEIMALLFDYYYHTESDQDQLFPELVISLPNTLRQYNNAPDQLVEQMEKDLRNMYSRYFTDVYVSVSHDASPSNNEYSVTIILSGRYNNKPVDLATTIQTNREPL